MKSIKRAWRYIRDRQWAVSVAVVLAVVAELPALAELVTGEVRAAGDEFSWTGLLLVVAGVVIKGNVWARETVSRVADAQGNHPSVPA